MIVVVGRLESCGIDSGKHYIRHGRAPFPLIFSHVLIMLIASNSSYPYIVPSLLTRRRAPRRPPPRPLGGGEHRAAAGSRLGI